MKEWFQGLSTEALEREERAHLRPLVGAVLAIVAGLVLAGLFYASKAGAAPRAASAQECANFSDIALVARALAEEKVPADTARAAMRRIYDVNDGRGEKIFLAIVKAAYAAELEASAFANLLGETCQAARGNMDAILGDDA